MTSVLLSPPGYPSTTIDQDDEAASQPVGGTDSSPDPETQLDAKGLQRMARYAVSETASEDPPRNWTVALGLLAASLRGLEFSQVAIVAGFQAETLVRVLHGDLTLQASKRSRVARMLEVTRQLRNVLNDDAVGDWFLTPIPALKGETPLEAVQKRKLDQVEQVVRSYLDPSYA